MIDLFATSLSTAPERAGMILAYIDPGTGGLPYHFLGPLWAWLLAFLAVLLTQAKRIWTFAKNTIGKWKEIFHRRFGKY